MEKSGMCRRSVFVFLVTMLLGGASVHAVTVIINEGTQYQLIEGWGACAGLDVLASDARAKSAYRELGCNIIRVAIEPCILMAAGGNLSGPMVDLTADINNNVTKFNFEHSRYYYWDDVVEWLVANALEPSRVKIVGSCWSPPNWAKAPTGAYVDTGGYGAGVTPFIAYCNECDSVGGTWDDGTYSWNAYQYCSRFLAAWCKGFSQHCGGIPIYGLSIQNEVAYENPFNSCTLYHQAIPTKTQQTTTMNYNVFANALKAVKDEFALHTELAGVKMMGPHHANLNDTPGNPWGLLWQMEGIRAVKNHSDPALNAYMPIYTHNYGAPSAKRAEMYRAYWEGKNSMPGEAWAAWTYAPGIAGDGKQTWNSEFGGHAPSSWTNMLDMGTDLHCQMVWANESAIIHWAFCESSLTEHNLLATSQLNDPNQSMKYAVFKHFSRYVRPGARRVSATFSDGSTSWGGSGPMEAESALNLSAYVHEADKTVTIVLVNNRAEQYSLDINVTSNPNVTTYKVFRSSSSERFAPQADLNVSGGRVSLTIPAQSVVTLTGVGAGEVPPSKAGSPNPANSATGVSVNADLSWAAGAGATSHDVYFGTSEPLPFVGNQTSNTYDPGTLANNTTYYWRIDEKNAYGTTTGDQWQFTTEAAAPPGQAGSPNPGNGATQVSCSANLSWTAGAGATSHDVYFGVDSTPDAGEFRGNQTATTFDPGKLLAATTYYWRIDEKNAYGTTTGIVWSFTTGETATIELDSTSSRADSDSGGSTLSFSHTIGSGNDRVLVVGLVCEGNVPGNMVVSSVKYNGVTMIPVPGSSISVGTSWRIKTDLYYLPEDSLPLPGSYAVAVTYAGQNIDRMAGAVSLFNVDPVGPEAVAAKADGNDVSTISTNITTLTPGAWVVDAVGSGNSGAFTTTAGGMVERWDVSAESSNGAGSTKPVATAGQTAMSWQHDSAKRMTHSLAVFAPASGYYPVGDLNLDRSVDIDDLDIFAGQWLDTGGCTDPNCADLDKSNRVDFVDFALMGENWGL